jgi:hypothetical protein
LLVKPVRSFEEPLHHPLADSTRSATLIGASKSHSRFGLVLMVLALAKLRGVRLGR